MCDQKTPGRARAVAAAAMFGLAIAALASGVLAATHLRGLEAPGCGNGGGCGRLLAGAWATVPLTDWPLAFLGVAYFPAWLVAWRVSRGRPDRRLRAVARLGGAVSIALVAVMVGSRQICPWCLAVHAANLVFLAAVSTRAPGPSSAAGGMAFAAVFVVLSGGLAAAGAVREGRWERERSRSERVITASIAASTSTTEPIGFTGRHRLGPARAAVRVVMFFDYQCPLCAEFERQAELALRSHSDISVSVRHFPLDGACNASIQGPTDRQGSRGGSCRAARAAEAAGVLGGDAAFFALHRWLFEHQGAFDSVEELRGVVARAGIDFPSFIAMCDSDQVADNIESDIREAERLGLLSTPMVFINGVELKGVGGKDALLKTIAGVMAASPPARTARDDAPPEADRKVIEDWTDGSRVNLPARLLRWSRGPGGAKVDVVVWGDYTDPETRRLDRWLRDQIGDAPRFRYAFRHAPADGRSFEAALAAEAGGRLGGEPGFWAVHAWLMNSQGSLDLASLVDDLAASGVDRQRYVSALRSADALKAVRNDGAAAMNLNPAATPLLFVNGRWAPRWRLGDRIVLGEILAAAAEEKSRHPFPSPAPPRSSRADQPSVRRAAQ